jgi:hypothetical protein
MMMFELLSCLSVTRNKSPLANALELHDNALNR